MPGPGGLAFDLPARTNSLIFVMTRRGEILLVAKDGIKMTHAVEPRLLSNFMRIVEPLALFEIESFLDDIKVRHLIQRGTMQGIGFLATLR